MNEKKRRRRYLKTAAELAAYYAAVYFLDRFLMAPYIDREIHGSSYDLPGLFGVTAVSVILVCLFLLAPFLAGRMNVESWAAWGPLALLLHLAVYALASLVVAMVTGDVVIHTGISAGDRGLNDILRLFYMVALYCAASWLGSRSARAGVRARVLRRTRKLAVG